jgi:hypothetical protein
LSARDNLRSLAALRGLPKARIDEVFGHCRIDGSRQRSGVHVLAGYEATTRYRRSVAPRSGVVGPRRADHRTRSRRHRRDPDSAQGFG